MIRTDKWKYWWNYRDNLDARIYDLENDPLEKNNLINDPSYQEKVEELKTILHKWAIENKSRNFNKLIEN